MAVELLPAGGSLYPATSRGPDLWAGGEGEPLELRLFVVAGEASGDQLGAEVISALKTRYPDLRLKGMGGPALEREGVDRLVDSQDVAVVGILEVVHRIPAIVRAFRVLARAVADWRPHAVLLIDFPDFNLRLARSIHKLRIPVLYYVSPQLWAWRHGRIRTVARYVHHMMVIFPFEAELYRRNGIPVTYVGHPLVDRVTALPPIAPKSGRRRVALLPGSRSSEIRAILPALLRASEELKRLSPEVELILVKAPSIRDEELHELLNGVTVPLEITSQPVLEVLRGVDGAWIASGTATLEAALAGTPMVVVYRVSWLTYVLARLLVRKISSIGMVNLVAGKRIVPERIQHLDAHDLAKLMLEFLDNDATRARTRDALGEILPQLGVPGAAVRVAEIVERFLTRGRGFRE